MVDVHSDMQPATSKIIFKMEKNNVGWHCDKKVAVCRYQEILNLNNICPPVLKVSSYYLIGNQSEIDLILTP